MPKKALITGITGQDGSYLAEFLLHKGYEVHGIIRRASTFNTKRIDHLYRDPHNKNIKMFLHYGDMTDSSNLNRILEKVQPDEIYNLAAQSHVKVSFEVPEYTAEVDGIGVLRFKEFLEEAFAHLDLDWKEYIEIDPIYFRPTEVENLKADFSKAKSILNWSPKISFKDLVKIMVDFDLELVGLPSPGEGKRILQKNGLDWRA